MKRLFAVFGALLLVGILAVGVAAQSGSGGFYDFESSVRILQDLLVLDDVNVQDSLTVEGAASIAGVASLANMTSTGTVAETFLRLNPGTTQVLTFDSTLTPVASNQPISAAGAIGTSSIITKPAGTILRIVNVGSQTITFTDTGTLLLAGNAALGQYDTLMLLSDGTNWLQMGKSDN